MARRTNPFRKFAPRVEPRGGGFDAPEVDGDGGQPPVQRPLTVSLLSAHITGALEGLGDVLVQGELSQAKVHSSGHFYATLKDDQASISLVMWRSQVQRQGRMPGEGEQVVVRGSITTYPPRGQYQISATRITPVGAGDLAARFELLKAKLRDEGLFSEDTKRPLPFVPRAVGIATASGSAALADMIDSIRERFPTMPIIHAPCQVQGSGAAASVVAALRRLQRHPDVEVIICGRGGGSLEDLWAFNEEPVVRAIAACSVPIISAVGHETDTTLADLAADLRAKTPTAAAEIVVPEFEVLIEQLDDQAETLDAEIDDALQQAYLRLQALADHRALTGPKYQIELRQQRLDEWSSRLDDAVDGQLIDAQQRLARSQASMRGFHPRQGVVQARARMAQAQARLRRAVRVQRSSAEDRLAGLAGKLHALSPLAVIARGYAVLRTPEGRVVQSTADAPIGSTVAARIGDGWIDATVTDHRRQRLHEPEQLYDPT